MIGIIDIGMGNIKSVVNAIYEQGFDPFLISNPRDFNDATHIILPGVGHYKKAMQCLNEKNLNDSLKLHVLEYKKPLLGICLGMQLLLDSSEEGNTSGLGLIKGSVKKFNSELLRVPHVGWNNITFNQEHPVFHNVPSDSDYYFVHSFYCHTTNPDSALASTDYGHDFTSIVMNENIIGTQFHPEKSQINGLKIIENFCEWDGIC